MGSGTRVALTDAGSIVRSSAGVERFNVPRANVPLYGIACGGGLGARFNCNNLASSDGVLGIARCPSMPSVMSFITSS
jgi:hypothetical protein